MNRWGIPGGGPFRRWPFGVSVQAEAAFGGITIPARFTAGWWHGTSRQAGRRGVLPRPHYARPVRVARKQARLRAAGSELRGGRCAKLVAGAGQPEEQIRKPAKLPDCELGTVTMEQGSRGSQASAADPTPAAVAGYRQRLSRGEDVIDPETWAGSLPAAQGIAPRVRVGRDKWFNLLWLLPIGWGLLLAAVAIAQGLRNMPSVQRFMARYPGTLVSPGAHPGLPWWVDAQHFLNALFMIFIIRAGLQILADHARLYWTRHCTPGRDWFRFQKPVPADQPHVHQSRGVETPDFRPGRKRRSPLSRVALIRNGAIGEAWLL